MKKKTLVVEDLRSVNSNPDHAFRVVKLVNTVRFVIGSVISEHDVKTYANRQHWTVNVVKKGK